MCGCCFGFPIAHFYQQDSIITCGGHHIQLHLLVIVAVNNDAHPHINNINSRSEIIKWANRLFDDNEALIVDTETTGLNDTDEIIQLAIIDLSGKVLLNTLLRSTKPVTPEARTVHGITDQSLDEAPSMVEVYDEIISLIGNRHLVAYNAEFDKRMLRQTCERYELPELASSVWDCVMVKYAYFWGNDKNTRKRQDLSAACIQQGIAIDEVHDAAQDCLLTLKLIEAMADANPRRSKSTDDRNSEVRTE